MQGSEMSIPAAPHGEAWGHKPVILTTERAETGGSRV